MLFSIYLVIVVLLTAFYIYLMARYYEGFVSLPQWNVPKNHAFSTPITIIIPVRNEADNIIKCLESILINDFPLDLLEIIVVNDHSTDQTAALITDFNHPNVQLLHLADFDTGTTQAFKKKGIEIAVHQAKGKLILTTDGDCVANPNWLPLMVSYYETHQPKFIAAPVNFHEEQSKFEKFQSLDFAGMIALTGAGIHRKLMNMCNGANLAYEKSVFQEVNGFDGINQKASGDDMMLLQKVARRYPNGIGFVKNENACTYTKAKPDWKSFYQQRVRWASKSTSYDEWQVTFYLGMIWLFCVSIPFSLLLVVFFGVKMLLITALQWLVKIVVDYFYLGMVSRYFKRNDLMKTFWTASVYHLLYIILIGAVGNLVKKYEWKGRKVE